MDENQLADGKYKALREKRDIAIFGACIYELTDQPTFVQMNNAESPDAFLLQRSEVEKTTINIAPVEITFYGVNKFGSPKESLFERLDKPGGKFKEKLPPKYWLLIHIGVELKLNSDHLKIANYLKKINAKFGVFSIQEISKNSKNDTLYRFIKYNPEYVYKDINIGEVFKRLQNSDIPCLINQKRGSILKLKEQQ